MTSEQTNVLASLLPTLRLSTLRTLFQFQDYMDNDAAELVRAELKARGKEIRVQRGDHDE